MLLSRRLLATLICLLLKIWSRYVFLSKCLVVKITRNWWPLDRISTRSRSFWLPSSLPQLVVVWKRPTKYAVSVRAVAMAIVVRRSTSWYAKWHNFALISHPKALFHCTAHYIRRIRMLTSKIFRSENGLQWPTQFLPRRLFASEPRSSTATRLIALCASTNHGENQSVSLLMLDKLILPSNNLR